MIVMTVIVYNNNVTPKGLKLFCTLEKKVFNSCSCLSTTK